MFHRKGTYLPIGFGVSSGWPLLIECEAVDATQYAAEHRNIDNAKPAVSSTAGQRPKRGNHISCLLI